MNDLYRVTKEAWLPTQPGFFVHAKSEFEWRQRHLDDLFNKDGD